FRIQQVRAKARLAELRDDIAARRLRLLEHMGLHPDTPVTLDVEAVVAPAYGADPASADVALLMQHPEARIAVAAYDVAEQTLRLELARQHPDLTIGPAFEREQ